MRGWSNSTGWPFSTSTAVTVPAAGAVIGVVAGYVGRQPVAGLVIGVAIGAALAVAIWLLDRGR